MNEKKIHFPAISLAISLFLFLNGRFVVRTLFFLSLFQFQICLNWIFGKLVTLTGRSELSLSGIPLIELFNAYSYEGTLCRSARKVYGCMYDGIWHKDVIHCKLTQSSHIKMAVQINAWNFSKHRTWSHILLDCLCWNREFKYSI